MTYTTPGTRKYLTAALFGVAIALPTTPQAALDDIVFLKFESTDTTMPWAVVQGGAIDLEKACLATNMLILQMASGLASSGMLSHVFDYLPVEPGPGVEGFDCSKAKETKAKGRVAITYTSCSMLMTDGVHTLRWIVPPDAPEAQMIIADAQTKEILKDGEVMLETKLGELPDFAKGRQTSQTVKPASGSKSYEIPLEIGPTGNYSYSTETYTGRAHSFDYSGVLALPGMEAMTMPGMDGASFTMEMNSKGTAYIPPDVPGSDVVAKFYENFKNYVTPATGQGTLFTAMIEQMADLVAYGIPLETTQTVKIGGGLAQGFAFSGMGSNNTSTSKVTSIKVSQGAASEKRNCGYFETPEGFEEISMQQMMSGANASPQETQQMNEAMQQLQNLPPEQRQMLEQFNLGGLMQQAPAASPPAQSARATSARSAMPSSKDLYSDDLTQMIQNHLDALGYDTGNTSGEMSLETTIAISQFQAEKGLKVTGEVSPQLAGVLSAEVDRRR